MLQHLGGDVTRIPTQPASYGQRAICLEVSTLRPAHHRIDRLADDCCGSIVMLLRTASLAASGRSGAEEIETAQEKVNEALEHLRKIDAIKKIAGSIEKNAAKIDRECEGLNATIRRLLGQALAALAGSDPIGPAGPATLSTAEDGAA